MPTTTIFILCVPLVANQLAHITLAPELVAEVAASSADYDLHEKLKAYERNQVLEYVVWRVGDEAIDWFTLKDGNYVPLRPNPDGILRSEAFPGDRHLGAAPTSP